MARRSKEELNYRRKLRKAGIDPDMYFNEYHTMVLLPAPDPDPTLNPTVDVIRVRNILETIAEKAQKEVRTVWGRKYHNFIIIIEPCSRRNKTIAKYECSVHMLKMTKAITKEFEDLCKEKLELLAEVFNKIEKSDFGN